MLKNILLSDMRGEEGAQEMGFLRLIYATFLAFLVTFIYNQSVIAASQELSAGDIVEIITAYYENELKFERDYLDQTLSSTMFFANVREKAFINGYFMSFDGVGGSAGLTCSFSETLPSEFIDWDAGKPVFLTGVVSDVVLSTLYLETCEFN